MKLALLHLVEKRGCSTFDQAHVDLLMLAQVTMQHGRNDAPHGHGRASYCKRPATTLAEARIFRLRPLRSYVPHGIATLPLRPPRDDRI